MSRLCERDDFPDVVVEAGRQLGINPAIVEKDYFVTEALRIIADRFGDLVLFKGGTSLSKGWKLLDRFSEDIDLYVQEDQSSSRSTKRRLKSAALAVNEHPHLSRDAVREVSLSFGRTDYFEYSSRVTYLQSIVPAVMLEAGIQSGDYPTEERLLQSLLAEVLNQRGLISGAQDQAPFPMRLLHFRRTFVEKLYTIHDRVERHVKHEGQPLGSYARHYYDLFRLLQTPDVITTLSSSEFADIATDYRRLTRKYYPRQALPPVMELANSSALFPEALLRAQLASDYQARCRRLCYRPFPSFEEVLAAFESIRQYLLPVPEAP